MADARIAERPIGALVQIGTWPADAAAAAAILKRLLGFAPPSPGHAEGSATATLMGLAPGRWLLAADDPTWTAKLSAAFAEGQAAVTDLSAARLCWRVEGPEATVLLRQGIGFDLDATAFPPGRCAQTTVHHMGVLLHRLGAGSFDLYASRSLGRSFHEWLLDAG